MQALITDHRNIGQRSAFEFYREDSLLPIKFYVNPSECSWTLGLRTSIDRVAGGAIHYDGYADRLAGQSTAKKKARIMKFDLGQIRFSFQSGPTIPGMNVDIVRNNAKDPSWGKAQDFIPDLQSGAMWNENGEKVNRTGDYDVLNYDEGVTPKEVNQIPEGLGNFYDFLALLDKPNVQKNGAPNFVVCHYISSLFLPKITIKGFFTPEGVSWTDSADNPSMITSWTATMDIYETTPHLNDALKLKESLKGFHFRNLGLGN